MQRSEILAWWKVAALATGYYRAARKPYCLRNITNRIRDSARQLESIESRSNVAGSRRWDTGSQILRGDYQKSLTLILGYAEQAISEMKSPPKPNISVNDVFHDLLALKQEFFELQFDRREQQLSVLTRDIELKRLQLGGFRIVLNLDSLTVGKRSPARLLTLGLT